MSNTYSIICIILSLIASLFFFIGCLSNSDSQSTVKGTAWIIYNEKVTLETSNSVMVMTSSSSSSSSDSTVIATVHQLFWFGLKNFYYSVYSDDDKIDDKYDQNSNESYSSDECSSLFNFCDTCQTEGKNAVGLVAVGLVFAVISAVLNIVLAANNQKLIIVNVFGVITSFISFLFSLIGVCLFMGKCLDKIKDYEYADSSGVGYGPGSIIVIIGIIFMIVTFICSLFNLFDGSGGPSGLNEPLEANHRHQQTTIPVVTANPIATAVYVKN
jgi:hypothetical protein